MTDDVLPRELQADVDTIARLPIIPKILEVICQTTGMGFAVVARVTKERWVACAVHDEISFGLKTGGELELETTICHEILQSGNPVVIDNVVNDPIFCDHLTPALYGFESYISTPIYLKNGSIFGTLCAIDPHPAQIKNAKTLNMFKLYSELISSHMDGLDRVDMVELQLEEERKALKLREQFIAILGHDLRNPLGAISSSLQMILRQPLNEKTRKVAEIAKNSSSRMNELIENVLDFARADQGSGISIQIKSEARIGEIIKDVISELQASWPERQITFIDDLSVPVKCDGSRIAQLLSNLLGNALTHGDSDGIIKVIANSTGETFELSVANTGKKIPNERMAKLFEPYERGADKDGGEGLGLGLYICSEIARAHGGNLAIESTDLETKFTLSL